MSKYLYGASIQGIQSFIFETNKLREVVGASEIVEKICTTIFYENAGINENDENVIISTAGNIKYIFNDKSKCEYLVRVFPKIVSKIAPGITISQAVVKFEGEDYSKHIHTLECNLKVQRNRASAPVEVGYMGLERSRRTGKVAFEFQENRKHIREAIDRGTCIKLHESKNGSRLFQKMAGFVPMYCDLAFDIGEITKSGNNSWVAVIHADGNGIGNILQNKGAEIAKAGKLNRFSKSLDNATLKAINRAFKEIIMPEKNENNKFPVRPILIGGDDVTIIVRADLALTFTEKFLEYFELETSKEFTKIDLGEFNGGLSACAGISFIKDSYPLHYGLHLAEELCKDAKKMVKATNHKGQLINQKFKDMPKSALSFYKVQESFTQDLQILKERTLQTKENLSYYYGPYLLENIIDLNNKLAVIANEAKQTSDSKATGKIRQIISETYRDKSIAVFMLERLKEMNYGFYEKLELDKELKNIKSNSKSQLLDLVTLNSLNYGNKEN